MGEFSNQKSGGVLKKMLVLYFTINTINMLFSIEVMSMIEWRNIHFVTMCYGGLKTTGQSLTGTAKN